MIKIAGTARALPAKCVTSDMLGKRLSRDVSLFAATGVEARYFCEDKTQIDLAVVACQAAIGDAGLVKDDIDMVISGSAMPYQTVSGTAPLIMPRLGIAHGHVSAFDANSTCLRFLTGVEYGHSNDCCGASQTRACCCR